MNVNEFKEVVTFIMSHFKAARNRKNTSGQHEHFGEFVEGKSRLLCLHNVTESIGDKALCDCACAELDEEVKTVSGEINFTPKVIRRGTPSPTSSVQSYNLSIEAKKAVLDAIANKNSEVTRVCQCTRILELRDIVFENSEKLVEVKASVKVMKEKLANSSGEPPAKINELRECANKAMRKKKKHKSHLLQAKFKHDLLENKTDCKINDSDDSDADALFM